MAYVINTYNGTQIAVVSDGTIDNSLDIKLIGKNYAGYGEAQNENFVYMLENFANNKAPLRPLQGQLWYDTGTQKLKIFDANSVFKTVSGAEYSSTQPTNTANGDFWFNTETQQLNIKSNDSYLIVGPEMAAGFSSTRFRYVTVNGKRLTNNVKDDSNEIEVFAIIAAVVTLSQSTDEVVFVISSNAFYLESIQSPGALDYSAFSFIGQGITMADGISDISGAPSPSNFMSNPHKYFGTATDADRLGGHVAGDYLLSDNVVFTEEVKFSDAGYKIGEDLKVWNDSGTIPTFFSYRKNSKMVFQVGNEDSPLNEESVINSSVAHTTIIQLQGSKALGELLPGTNVPSIPINIGSNANKFNNIFATIFTGTATQSDTLKINDNGSNSYNYAYTRNPVTTVPTVMARDANNDTWANIFNGTATSARYADLAEKYIADKEYDVGTVMVVGGKKEVTSSKVGDRAIGVISLNPAIMMNSELENGTYIALKGRVPVKVLGAVKKGDTLIAGNNGVAIIPVQLEDNLNVFAIVLESSDNDAVKLVECVIL